MPTFSHEKLRVYQDALEFIGAVIPIVETWDSCHAVRDHLPRAGESIVENIAQACAVGSMPLKQRFLDVAMGSTLECGACIDIAATKGLLSPSETTEHKVQLVGIASMLVGLRKAWEVKGVREEPADYGSATAAQKVGFHHEQLDVYQVALRVVHWLWAAKDVQNLPLHIYRKLDAESTSIVLNIAEGNGKYSARDHRRFLAIANRAAIKLASQLDICVKTGVLKESSSVEGKEMLFRIGSMTAVLMNKVSS